MEAIVLAGGLGTRLRSVVDDVPKPMAPVAGRPFVAFVLDQLASGGFETVVLAVGYRHESIRTHFGDGYRGVALKYSVESTPLGTGGAIRLASVLTAERDVFVLNGDTYLELDFGRMLGVHRDARASITIAVCRAASAMRYGALAVDAGIVTGFHEKGCPGPGWINGGTYVLSRDFLSRFPDESAFSFEQDVLVPQVARIRPVAFACEGTFIDIGVPEDYARAPALLGNRH